MFARSKDVSRAILPVSLGAMLFIIPTILNGFPFIFPDSGDYLVLRPLLHRSPYYGLFITFFHLNHFIWLPIVMQCLVVSHLLWLMLQRVSGAASTGRFLVLALILTLATTLPFFTGFIMADIFTSILFLTMYLLAFHLPSLSRPLVIYLLLLDCVATSAHISHLTLGVSILILFSLLILISGERIVQRFKAIALLVVPIGAAGAAILLFNVVIFGAWSLSPAGQSFFMANLIQYGPARHYLQTACPAAGYKICAYVDILPETADDFLWSSGLFQKLGSFPGMQSEAAEIVRKTVETRPAEVVAMVGRNFSAGLLKHEPAAEFYSSFQVPSFAELMSVKFGPATRAAYENSAEMRDAIPHDLIRTIDQLATPLAFLALCAVALSAIGRRSSDTFMLATAVIFFILGNTLLCTTLSGVHDRYQARVTWLAMMALIMLGFGIWQRKATDRALSQ